MIIVFGAVYGKSLCIFLIEKRCPLYQPDSIAFQTQNYAIQAGPQITRVLKGRYWLSIAASASSSSEPSFTLCV